MDVTKYNFGARGKWSDDPAKPVLELICDKDGCKEPHICDIDDGDWLGTLACVTADHYTAKHGGEGNFTL